MTSRRSASGASSCHAAAREYARRGWSVVPVEHAGKRPLVAWMELQTRRASLDEIEAWFSRQPQANVGVVTGAVSGVVVLDVDAAHGGMDSIAAWEAQHGPLPTTVEARTGGGGRHVYFLHPGQNVPNRVAIAPGVDIRGDGGCIVAPPSAHASGGRYAWLPGHAPHEVGLAPMPHWLLGLLRSSHGQSGHRLSHWRRLVREGVEQGARNSTIASLAGHLLWHGVDAQVVLEMLMVWNEARCRPPLSADEVARVVASVTRAHERGGDDS
jgi:hypothetical protein